MTARSARRRFALLALSLLAAGGCGAPDLYIDALVAPPPGSCDLRSPLELRELQTLTLDVAFREDYVALLRVGNTSGERWTPGSARVSLTQIDGTPLVEGVQIPVTGTVSGRYGLLDLPLLPREVGQEFASVVRNQGRGARLTVLVTLDFGPDSDVLEASWRLNVCHGCLVDFPLAALDADGQCSTPPDGASADAAPPPHCRLGQDDPVDCRLCADEVDVCQNP